MVFLTNFFMLRWSLPRWLIPLIWTIYFLEHVWISVSLMYSSLGNHTNVTFLWFIIQTVWYLIGSQIVSAAIVGVLLFTAQNLLFGKLD